jgi:hypothetical protein
MEPEEYKDEITRRDDIIDSYKGIESDFLYVDAKMNAIKNIIESRSSEHEKIKMIRALIIYA